MLEEARNPPRNFNRDYVGVPEHVLEPYNRVWGSDFWFLLTCLVVCASIRFFVKISASYPQVGFSMLSTKGMPSRISKEYYQLAKTLAILNYPRKALPSNWIFSNVHERLCLQMYF